jgi:hypothetical protein
VNTPSRCSYFLRSCASASSRLRRSWRATEQDEDPVARQSHCQLHFRELRVRHGAARPGEAVCGTASAADACRPAARAPRHSTTAGRAGEVD